VGEQSTEPIHDASQSFGSKVLNKPSILVIGTNGSQPANIKKAFDKDEVSLTFAKAGSRKALGSGDRPDRVVIWKKFVGHRDTQANPNAVVVDGGLGQVIQAIRNLVSNYHAE
jgi:hypothetical protein